MNRLIIFSDKYSTRIFDASTPELLSRACLKVLRERFKEGYFYLEPELSLPSLSAEDAAIMALTEEQVAGLPEPIKGTTAAKRKSISERNARFERTYEEEKAWYDRVVSLCAMDPEEGYKVEDKSTRRGRKASSEAVALMSDRADYQYEGFELKQVESYKE